MLNVFEAVGENMMELVEEEARKIATALGGLPENKIIWKDLREEKRTRA